MKVYTMKALAAEVGVSVKTLRTWRQSGWLRPACMAGGDERYSMESFEVACRESLLHNHYQATPEPVHDPNWAQKIARQHGYS